MLYICQKAKNCPFKKCSHMWPHIHNHDCMTAPTTGTHSCAVCVPIYPVPESLWICNKAHECDQNKCSHFYPHKKNTDPNMSPCENGRCKKGDTFCVPCAEEKTQGENENMNNEIKIGYKVVKVEDGKLVSASVDKGSIEYEVGKTMKPKMWAGPLTVFSSKFRAIGFIAELSDTTRPKCRVYKCHYETTKAAAVWRLVNYMPESKKLSDLPEGTVLAKNVTLNEEIFRA